MEIKVRNSKDLYAGLLFIVVGLLATLLSTNYPIGSAGDMGPGYFPFAIGRLLTILGVIIAAPTLWREGQKAEPWGYRPLLQVLGAVLAFAATIKPFGLVVGTMLVVTVSCFGGTKFSLREVVILFLGLAVLGIGIFVYALNLPFKVWPL